MSAGLSKVYAEDGQRWLRVSPGHAISEHWLQDNTPELYARWWASPHGQARDQIALQIERRIEDLERPRGGRHAVNRDQPPAPPSALAERVVRYEQHAQRLGAIALTDPGRPAAHLAHQAEGDTLRAELAATHGRELAELLERRLDAADLLADRPVIDAVCGLDRQLDRLAAAALADAADVRAAAQHADLVRAEMTAENPHAALRADIFTAVTAAGHDPGQLRREIELHGLDLARMAPTLTPASDFYARHAPAIEAYLDTQISAAGFPDLPTYLASWTHDRPASTSLHDTEQALVAHVIADVILAADDAGRDVREAHRMWQRAAGRATIRDPSAALERGDLEHDDLEHGDLELALDRHGAPEQQLELALPADDGIDADADTGHDVEQEVG